MSFARCALLSAWLKHVETIFVHAAKTERFGRWNVIAAEKEHERKKRRREGEETCLN